VGVDSDSAAIEGDGMKKVLWLALAAAAALAQTAPTARQIARRLTANDLKADVSFLASDALEGRGTPSKGLDIAAEYIAAQFRRAGLEPAGDDGYFQTAAFSSVKTNTKGLELTLDIGGKKIKVDRGSMLNLVPEAVDLDDAPMDNLFPDGTGSLSGDRPVLTSVFRMRPPGNFNPPLVVLIQDSVGSAAGTPFYSVLVPASRPVSAPVSAPPTLGGLPVVSVWDPAVRSALAAGATDVKVSAHLPAPIVEPITLRSVVGVLRGSDPALKDTCLVLSAHYYHLGMRADGDDRIFNGADDDASGVSAVIETAAALAALPARPKRSIVFVAFFGEEVGELGSHYYVQHPVFPAAKTIADVNLEQLGRTDDSEGPRIGQFNLTGFDFTTMAPIFRQAAEDAGVHAVKDQKNSDPYFGRSDNAVFANAGIPSTTVSVAYMFPDYHGVGDEWPKLDYDNMAKVGRAIALAAFRLADSAEAPRWNPENPKTARYRRAR
jgi:hypothetical protein